MDRPDEMTFSLTALGETVALVISRPYEWHVELSPEAPLEPSTEHVLTLEWPTDDATESASIEFTTGAGPVETTPAVPDPQFQRYDTRNDRGTVSCTYPLTGACISVPDDVVLIARHLDQFGQFDSPGIYLGSFLTDRLGNTRSTSEQRLVEFSCVELRSRAPNGATSAPMQVCTDDVEVQTLSAVTSLTCTSAGLNHNGTVEPPSTEADAAACGVSHRGSGSLGLLFLASPFLAALRRSRARLATTAAPTR